ncbi:hypothetical protein [Alphaentomopoxvirus acuprea]|uniref:Uncharacterized protein n=1 Tax=Alphaentomopoxvirus acuprea TaxID=62099 RepID=W6JPK9_9POXV|nr:hypothetical protein BA82_gp099 [Anomala cuprea entomopoxvirus]BAO49459.1 hypothetical protein [Anomala cuprea entomopoxvirus]
MYKIMILLYLFLNYTYSENYKCPPNIHPSLVLTFRDLPDCENTQAALVEFDIKILNEQVYITDLVLIYAKVFYCYSYSAFYFWAVPQKKIIYIDLYKYNVTMLNNTLDYNNEKFIYNDITNTYILGKEEFECDYSIFNSETSTYFITLKRDKLEYKLGEMRSNLEIYSFNDCNYIDGYCKLTQELFILWTVNKDATLEFSYKNIHEVGAFLDNNNNYHFIFNLDNIKQSVVVTNISDVDIEGYTYTSNKAYRIKLNNKYINRIKRDSVKYSDIAQLQYISDIEDTYKEYLSMLCKELKSSELRFQTICSIDPYSCISNIINENAIRVENIGKYFFVYSCFKVDIIEYLPTYNTLIDKCNTLIPVKYSYNEQYFNGYLDYYKGQIFDSSPYLYQGHCNDLFGIYVDCIDDKSSICKYDLNSGVLTKVNLDLHIIDYTYNNKINYNTKTNVFNTLSKPTFNDYKNYYFTHNIESEINHKSILNHYSDNHTSLFIIVLIILLFTLTLIFVIIYIIIYVKYKSYVNIHN